MKLNISEIELIVYDFDGVMTNNFVFLSEDGTETVKVSRSDGMGVSLLRGKGIQQIIISTESNNVVSQRAKKLKIDVIQDCGNKKIELQNYCKDNKISLDKVIFVGNDLNDFDAMNIVGYPISPADAHPQVKTISHYVTKVKGGEGVIRELADVLLKQDI